jgi:hypothetical protein
MRVVQSTERPTTQQVAAADHAVAALRSVALAANGRTFTLYNWQPDNNRLNRLYALNPRAGQIAIET